MDFQKMVDNSIEAKRAEEMKTSEQLTLGELILKLEAIDPQWENHEKEMRDKVVAFEFEYLKPTGLSSWRGSYRELAIEFDGGKEYSVKEFIKELKGAVGKTYQGYKGGDFLMGKATPLWVANDGNSGETAVVDIRDDTYNVYLVTKQLEY